MRDPEEILRSAPLAQPSSAHERRMAALLAAPALQSWERPLWVVSLLGGAAMLAAAFWPVGSTQPAPNPVIYRLRATGTLEKMLLGTPADQGPPAFRIVTIKQSN